MKITATLTHGSVDAEFVTEDREELENELLEFASFLSVNEETFGSRDSSSNGQNLPRSALSDSPVESGIPDEDRHPLSTLARKIGVPADELDKIVYVDPDGDEMPQLLLDKNRLGGNRAERQRTGAYVILRVWEDCYGNERMKTSQLKEILSLSGISDVDLYEAWRGSGKGSFDSTGHGPSASVGLTGPGKREALTVMQDLTEKKSE